MPKRKLLYALVGLMAISSAASSIQAADLPMSPGLKLHYGMTQGNLHQDLNANSMLGIGLTLDLAKVGQGTVFGELTYSYFAGLDFAKQFDPKATPFVSGTPGGTVFPGGRVYANTSADNRKNQLTGFDVRGGYRAPLGWGWNWQAGLSLESLKYEQQASGQLFYNTPTILTTQASPFNESIATTSHTNKMNLGAFGGLQFPFGEAFSFEVNLATVGYSSINYVPKVYSGATVATTETKTRRGFVLDFAIGTKF